MYYYKVEKRIIEQTNKMDSNCNNYPELNEQEIAFYLANPNATLQEIENLQLNPVVVSLEELKQTKLNLLDQHFGAIFAQGFEDTESGFTLFCFEKDVQNYATLKNAIADLDDNFIVEIGTMTGWQTSTKAVVYSLLVRYSAYMLPLTTNYLKLKSYIEYAQTETELELIVW